ITAQPSNQVVCSGATASFSVTATGTALTYQWQLSTDNGTTFNNIAAATASSFTTAATVAADNGKQYRVVVGGTCSPSVTSSAATLTVNTAPAITGQPTAQTVCAGSTASFTVTATGTALTYQWRKNGVAISNGATGNG